VLSEKKACSIFLLFITISIFIIITPVLRRSSCLVPRSIPHSRNVRLIFHSGKSDQQGRVSSTEKASLSQVNPVKASF